MGTVVDRNTTLPVSMTRTFTTVRDNQDVVKVVVRQGEDERAEANEFLGEFSLEGIREAPKMEPRVDVTFKIDANGILHVTAIDRDTGESQTVRIKDYMEKAAGEAGAPTTDVQLAKDLEDGAVAAAAAAGAADESGIFGRLKGLFGKKDGEPGAPGAGTTEIADRDAAAAASVATEVADRAEGPPPDSTDVADRAEGPPPTETPAPDTTEVADRDEFAEDADTGWLPAAALVEEDPGTDMAERAEGGGVAVDGSVAADLKSSFQQLADDDPDATAVAPRGSSLDGEPLAADGMMPLDDLPAPVSDGPAGMNSMDDDDDPFAVRERPQLDPFGVTGGAADPFGGEEGEAPDPFGGDGVQHSRRTRSSAGIDTLPADFDAASSPATEAAAKKKPARLKIRYKKAATFVKEFTGNLENGGAFIKTSKPLECGRRCRFELTLPGASDPVKIRGMVVWSSRGIDELPAGQAAGMGVRYDAEDTEGLEGLRRAVEDLTE